MLFRLALSNIKRSAKDFSIYFLTIAFGVGLFYAFNTISMQASFFSTATKTSLQMSGRLLTAVSFFIDFVLAGLMLYANAFLVRKRKREIALYQILGMSKGRVSIMLFFETAIATLISYLIGLAIGILLSQVLIFVSASIFRETVSNFHFMISGGAALGAAIGLAIIFVLVMLLNLFNISRVQLVELMSSARKNDRVKMRNFPLCIGLSIIGFGLMTWSYIRLAHDGLPVMDEDYPIFMTTTLIVFVGTIVFCYGFAGLLLYIAKSVKSFYYRDLNMVSMRQLASRFNHTSLSMGLISFGLFLAIAISSSGFTLGYIFNSKLDITAPYDASLGLIRYDSDVKGKSTSTDEIYTKFTQALAEKDVHLDQIADGFTPVSVFYYSSMQDDGFNLHKLTEAAHIELPQEFKNLRSETIESISTSSTFIRLSDYNRIRKLNNEEPIELHDQYYFLANSIQAVQSLYQSILDAKPTITFKGHQLSAFGEKIDTSVSATVSNSSMGNDGAVIVLPDELFEGLAPDQFKLNMNFHVDRDQALSYLEKKLYPLATFGDINSEDAGTRDTEKSLHLATVEGHDYALFDTFTKRGIEISSASNLVILSYLAIYIGSILIISAAAILAIQQLSSISDAAPNYQLLLQLGAERKQVTSSVFLQVALFFGLPALIAICHSSMALSELGKVLVMLAANNISTLLIITSGIFVVFYILYFLATKSMAKSIVFSKQHQMRS